MYLIAVNARGKRFHGMTKGLVVNEVVLQMVRVFGGLGVLKVKVGND